MIAGGVLTTLLVLPLRTRRSSGAEIAEIQSDAIPVPAVAHIGTDATGQPVLALELEEA